MSRTCLSIVSHDQFNFTKNLLESIRAHSVVPLSCLCVTHNNAATAQADMRELAACFPDVQHIINPKPLGFGANHNQAFAHARLSEGDYFWVLNPDVLFVDSPLQSLLNAMQDPQIALAAPRVLDEVGKVQDSWRSLLTPQQLLARILGRRKGAEADQADWAAGMCLLFRADAYQTLGGFDERYFMYCEDMDICVRAAHAGYKIAFVEGAAVLHPAQRDSHRKLRYLAWHIHSLLKFWWRFGFSGQKRSGLTK